eukprot:403350242
MFGLEKRQLLQIAGFVAVTAVSIGLFVSIKNRKTSVISDISIADILKIDKQNQFSLYLMATQKLPSILDKVDSRGKLTFYSLYKQINEGDADEAPGNDEITNPIKFKAWKSQKGKCTDKCQQEYIGLMTRYDNQFREIVDQLVTGKIKKIKVEDTSQTSGGILAKSVPRPKAEDQTQYIKGLTIVEKEMMHTYLMIREDKNEELLIKLLEEKKLQPGNRNKEGMNPLILAVDCEFTLPTLKKLIDLGCNINQQDAQGRCALHYAVDLENIEIIKFLIENGADADLVDETGSSPRDEAAMSDEISKILGVKEE